MSKFSPGDMALVVGCHRDPRNIGATCTLVRWVKAGDEYRMPNGKRLSAPCDAWFIEGEHIIGAYFNRQKGMVETPGFGIVDPKHLMPLRGDLQPEQQKSREVEA